ncbi:hypothetical protein AALO_G00155860 [Alosa alosa]|uniref:Uncharacterized protein n=1 Tax=Alosa alosa TaxID=278164 RepID=A0AAV6GK21_9TELE|nr:hypothetical protein AALO_G00155860 [Alosa alosa]
MGMSTYLTKSTIITVLFPCGAPRSGAESLSESPGLRLPPHRPARAAARSGLQPRADPQ